MTEREKLARDLAIAFDGDEKLWGTFLPKADTLLARSPPIPDGRIAREALENIAACNITPSTGAPVAMTMRRLATEALAALSDQRGSGWQPIETEPGDGNFRFYGLHIVSKQMTWFEAYYLARNEEGEMVQTCGDPFSEWSFEDFEVWAPAPVPPEQRGQK